jgi:hypothetical protein
MEGMRMTKHTPATPLPFTLRSHEVSKPGGDGTYHVNATYTVLQDGNPLGFSEHFALFARANAYPKLVEALRSVLPDLIYGTTGRWKGEGSEHLSALLRSLGEE